MLGGKAQIDHAIDPRQEGVNVGNGELAGQELRRQGAEDGVAKVCSVQLLMLPHHWVSCRVIAVATVIKNVSAPGAVCAAGIRIRSRSTARSKAVGSFLSVFGRLWLPGLVGIIVAHGESARQRRQQHFRSFVVVSGVGRGILRRHCRINLRFGILLDYCCLATLASALGRSSCGGEGFFLSSDPRS